MRKEIVVTDIVIQMLNALEDELAQIQQRSRERYGKVAYNVFMFGDVPFLRRADTVMNAVYHLANCGKVSDLAAKRVIERPGTLLAIINMCDASGERAEISIQKYLDEVLATA